MSDTSGHLERISPGAAPGTLYVRIVTNTDHVLAAHPIELEDAGDHIVTGQAAADSEAVDVWLYFNPAGRVYTYIYDGDDGECLKTIIIDGIDGIGYVLKGGAGNGR